MMGDQALYHEGWMLNAVHKRPKWELTRQGDQRIRRRRPFKFELYDVRNDWRPNADVAAQNPTKVKEMNDLMFGEFSKYAGAARSTRPSPPVSWRRGRTSRAAETCSRLWASR